MEFKFLKILNKSLMGSVIDSVKSLDKITVHNPFFSFMPYFLYFCPQKIAFCNYYAPSNFTFFSLYGQYNENKHI